MGLGEVFQVDVEVLKVLASISVGETKITTWLDGTVDSMGSELGVEGDSIGVSIAVIVEGSVVV